jgi:hypothetical protein
MLHLTVPSNQFSYQSYALEFIYRLYNIMHWKLSHVNDAYI